MVNRREVVSRKLSAICGSASPDLQCAQRFDEVLAALVHQAPSEAEAGLIRGNSGLRAEDGPENAGEMLARSCTGVELNFTLQCQVEARFPPLNASRKWSRAGGQSVPIKCACGGLH